MQPDEYKLPPVKNDATTPASDDTAINEPVSVSPSLPQLPDPVVSSQQVTYDGMALDAEDIDLIEKAWVEKAKAIVNDTQGDPFNQNIQINKMKADYIKKRFNRDVKTDEQG